MFRFLAPSDSNVRERPDLEFQERVITACELGKTLFKKVETSVDEAHANLEVTVGGTFNRVRMPHRLCDGNLLRQSKDDDASRIFRENNPHLQ